MRADCCHAGLDRLHIGYDPISLDELTLCSGLSTAPLQGELLMLELNGRIALLLGAYCRVA